MKSTAVETYFIELAEKFKTGQAREHAYRPVFEALIKSLEPSLKILNDPSRSEHGNPDFVFLRGDITAGYTETKDIGVDLDKTEKSEQMERYLGYSNLILTDYLEFRFFRNGQRYGEPIRIGTPINTLLSARPESFGELEDALLGFLSGTPEKIKSGRRLAEIMGGKARRIRDNVRHFLSEESERNKELLRVYDTIKRLLVHDLSIEAFADMYAQTLVYGLFVARFHDDSPKNFSRQEARDLIPVSNPFLRHFFDHIAGADFDKRLAYIVDELCEVFSLADVSALMQEYFKASDLWGEKHEAPDPVIHFYEDFLKEYDADQRKKLGAFYTPLPVVRFIIRAVDHLVEKEFDLPKGLADTTKITVERLRQGKKGKTDIHRVQILDPATGTGTFLNETVRSIASRFSNQIGRWSAYVDSDLLPRLHGFELMMAPYTIAHLKLGMTLKETGYSSFDRRLGIYLTNSLEEAESYDDTLFAGFGLSQSIAEEAREAGVIKRETPIMVVIGNPPYSGESSNSHYTGNDVYKVEPSGGKLQERNSKWLNDDYVKFIRFAESMIEKTGDGIVAMITAHGYIDNPTFRGMRWHLMQTFDQLYVLDLHGNSKKKEKTADGEKDENVFAIQQGVAILVGVKRKGDSKKKLAQVSRADCYGLRKMKFDYLNKNSLETIEWREIEPSGPNYEWVTRDAETQGKYREGFSVAELFPISSVGVVTGRDDMSIQSTKAGVEKVVQDFQMLDTETLRTKYDLGKDVQDWKVSWAKKDIVENFTDEKIVPIAYRPFDNRWTCYTGTSRGFLVRPRRDVMKHMAKPNLGLIVLRQVKAGDTYQHVFVGRGIVESTLVSNKTSEIDYVLPLYLYADDETRVPNLNKEIVTKISTIVGKESTPQDIFDYVYAVLYSPSYREKYVEFLKIDFPRVPYPTSANQFSALVEKGAELRALHLLESPKVNDFVTTYPIPGSNLVEAVSYKNGSVYINAAQYFGNVPEIAWNFYIGCYQPAQKWLKDRKGRALSNDDIEHYQKMVAALGETDRIMTEIDTAII